jgi:hypothetical protein
MIPTDHSRAIWLAVLSLLLCPLRFLADTITLSGGEKKSGRIRGSDADHLVLSIQPVPGLPAVDLRLQRSRVTTIDFDEDPVLDAWIQNATLPQLSEVAALWKRFEPLLTVSGSPSARIGLRYGLLLLEDGPTSGPSAPLAVFEKIAAAASSPKDREAAKQGILRALLQSRQLAKVEEEAQTIPKTKCGIPLLAETQLALGKVQAFQLKEWIQENPRWEEDDSIRDKIRHSLEIALDNFLGTAILPGVPSELAAQAMSGAWGVYQLTGDRSRAKTVANDLVTFHPKSPEARSAAEWLKMDPDRSNKVPTQADP